MDFSKILDAIKTALDVVKVVAGTPGLDAIPYLSTIAKFAGVLSEAIVFGGENIAPYVDAFIDTFKEGYTPTPEDIAALDTKIEELRAQLHAPLPPREEGEPE